MASHERDIKVMHIIIIIIVKKKKKIIISFVGYTQKCLFKNVFTLSYLFIF